MTMLASYYGFREEPFKLVPDLRFLVRNPPFEHAYQSLRSGIMESRGLMMLVGETGTGKTLLLRVLAQELEMAGAWVCVCSYPDPSQGNPLTSCCESAGLAQTAAVTPQAQLSALREVLTVRGQQSQPMTLLVDDGQELSREGLEAIRMLSELEIRDRGCLSIVVAGQPALETRLEQQSSGPGFLPAPECVVLQSMKDEELIHYIQAQLRQAGYEGRDLFTQDAYSAIYSHAMGIPRRVNLICGTALMLASLEARDVVTGQDVKQAVDDNWLDAPSLAELGIPSAADQPSDRLMTGVLSPANEDFAAEARDRLQRHDHRQCKEGTASGEQAMADNPTVFKQSAPNAEKAPPACKTVREVAQPLGDNEDSTQCDDYDKDDGWAPGRGESQGQGAAVSAIDWLAKPLRGGLILLGGLLFGSMAVLYHPVLTGPWTDWFSRTEPAAMAGVDKEMPDDTDTVRTPSEEVDSMPQGGTNRALAAAYSNLAIVYHRRQDLERSEEMYHKALAIHQTLADRAAMAREYNNLGSVYWSRGELDLAEEAFRKSFKIHKALGLQAGLADNCTNLGSIYWTRGNLDRAASMYRRALTINEALDRKEKLANSYANLGVVFQTAGEMEQAKMMHQKALSLYRLLDRETEGMANAYANLGSVYKKTGNFVQAETMYLKALALYQKIGALVQVKKAKELLSALRGPRALEPHQVDPSPDPVEHL
jgi:type II secretory pathway predicted ATPase ExeA/Tfp pilus assembly protein PilF